jgi:prolyl 4-hydroxylase
LKGQAHSTYVPFRSRGIRHPSEIAKLASQEDWRGEIVQLSWKPRAFLLKGFLSPEECKHLITKAKPSMSKSSVADNKTGKSFSSDIRTSTGTFLSKKADSVVAAIEKRVAQVTMIPEPNQEGLQILHYQDGQKYLPHHDYFHDEYNQDPKRGGQRMATVLMYLSTPEEGGETVFPDAEKKVAGDEWSECALKGMAVKAIRGDAVMFFSLNTDGTEDPTSLHGSCPTLKGEKWSATKWIHVGPTTGYGPAA